MSKSYKEYLNEINTFIFDVDGVLTVGTIHVTQDGELLRTMNIRNDYAMKAAIDKGYNICVISGGSNEGVRTRLRNLGVFDIHLGVSDKVAIYEQYLHVNNIKANQVLYMGDDLPDY